MINEPHRTERDKKLKDLLINALNINEDIFKIEVKLDSIYVFDKKDYCSIVFDFDVEANEQSLEIKNYSYWSIIRDHDLDNYAIVISEIANIVMACKNNKQLISKKILEINKEFMSKALPGGCIW